MIHKRITASALCLICAALLAFAPGAGTAAEAAGTSEAVSVGSRMITVTATLKDEQSLLAFEGETRPDSALLKTALSGEDIIVVGETGEEIGKLQNVMNALSVCDIVPIVGIYDGNTADAVAEFFKENNVIDAVLLSDDGELLYEARQIAQKVSGALEITDISDYDAGNAYETAVAIRDGVN